MKLLLYRFRLYRYFSKVQTVRCPESIILVNSQQSTAMPAQLRRRVNNHLVRATGIDIIYTTERAQLVPQAEKLDRDRQHFARFQRSYRQQSNE